MEKLTDLEKIINSELTTKINSSEIKHDQINLIIDTEDLIEVIQFLKTNTYTKFKQLIVIGDITCDLNGSIPTTLKSTTIKDPYFYYNKKELSECSQSEESIAVMAVDNLPSELPRDSSTEFGDGVLNEVLPFIIGKDDGRIYNATIIKKGKFLSRYSYIEKYIKK